MRILHSEGNSKPDWEDFDRVKGQCGSSNAHWVLPQAFLKRETRKLVAEFAKDCPEQPPPPKWWEENWERFWLAYKQGMKLASKLDNKSRSLMFGQLADQSKLLSVRDAIDSLPSQPQTLEQAQTIRPSAEAYKKFVEDIERRQEEENQRAKEKNKEAKIVNMSSQDFAALTGIKGEWSSWLKTGKPARFDVMEWPAKNVSPPEGKMLAEEVGPSDVQTDTPQPKSVDPKVDEDYLRKIQNLIVSRTSFTLVPSAYAKRITSTGKIPVVVVDFEGEPDPEPLPWFHGKMGSKSNAVLSKLPPNVQKKIHNLNIPNAVVSVDIAYRDQGVEVRAFVIGRSPRSYAVYRWLLNPDSGEKTEIVKDTFVDAETPPTGGRLLNSKFKNESSEYSQIDYLEDGVTIKSGHPIDGKLEKQRFDKTGGKVGEPEIIELGRQKLPPWTEKIFGNVESSIFYHGKQCHNCELLQGSATVMQRFQLLKEQARGTLPTHVPPIPTEFLGGQAIEAIRSAHLRRTHAKPEATSPQMETSPKAEELDVKASKQELVEPVEPASAAIKDLSEEDVDELLDQYLESKLGEDGEGDKKSYEAFLKAQLCGLPDGEKRDTNSNQ